MRKLMLLVAAFFVVVLLFGIPAGAGDYTFTHLAGSLAGAGSEDSPLAANARFYRPAAIAADANGNIFVADQLNHTIRKIAPNGEVTTVAGMAGAAGAVNGRGAAARFNGPAGIAVDAAGNIYVADSSNQAIRKIATTGQVTTFAGVLGSGGWLDGPASSARFNGPSGVAVGPDGTVYVSEFSNNDVRAIANGIVSTFAGAGGQSGFADGSGTNARFWGPRGIAAAADGALFVADYNNNAVRRIATDATVSTSARFVTAQGVAAGGAGSAFFVTDNNRLMKVDATGTITTVAGAANFVGDVDGIGTSARFNSPTDVDVDRNGNLIVADSGNHLIRRVAVSTNSVTTIAGTNGLLGTADGMGGSAKFHWPAGLAVDAAHNVYVCDRANHTIRAVSPDGTVTTLAGAAALSGLVDGTGSAARFSAPWGITTDGAGMLYVTDSSNNAIRAVTSSGTVTTLAGGSGIGSSDGAGSAAKFFGPQGIVYDGNGHLFVADDANSTIRRIDIATATVTTVAGLAGLTGTTDGNGAAARFNHPTGLAIDAGGNLYTADTFNNTIRRIAPNGDVTTLAGAPGISGTADGAGSAARFSQPVDVAYDAMSSSLFVTEQIDRVRQVTLAGVVTTVGGSAFLEGATDGTGALARFTLLTGVTADTTGAIYVTDQGSVRKGVPTLSDAAAASPASGPALTLRNLFVNNATASQFHWSIVRKPAGSTASVTSPDAASTSITPDLPDTWVIRLQALGATASSMTTVNVVATCSLVKPSITAGGPTTFCQGGSVTLTSSPALSYLWSTGATTQSITVSSSGSYTVTTTDSSGCSSTSDPASVTAVPYPSAQIEHVDATCADSTSFTAAYVPDAGAGATYSWSIENGVMTGGASSRFLTFQASAAGTVTLHVTVTNATGCSTSGSATLTAYADPVSTITVAPVICATSTDTVASVPDGGSGTSYSWSATGATITSGDGTPTIHFAPTGSGTISLRAFVSANGCGSTSTASVTVDTPQATITPSGPTTFCEGGSVTLTANGGASYLWSTGATTQSIVANTSGTYSVTSTDANGCNATASTTVTVNPLPLATITASGPTTFCSGGSITLTASAGATYLWSTGATTSSITVANSGSYSVTVTTASGCSATSAPTVVTVNPLPVIVTNGSGGNVCQGVEVATEIQPIADVTYQWSFAGDGHITQEAGHRVYFIVNNGTATLTVTVTDTNGCSSSATKTFISGPPIKPVISASGPTSFCNGGLVTLTSTPALTYSWSNGATTQSVVVNQSGSYTVTTFDPNGCTSTSDPVNVTAFPPAATPVVTASGPTTFCSGGTVTLTSSAGSAYLWSSGATTQSVTVSAAGNYSVTTTDANGCSATSAATTVTVNPLPIATITTSGPTTFCQGGTVTLTAPYGYSYAWSNGASTQLIVVAQSGSFAVTVTDANGCSATSAPVTVTVNANPATPSITANGPTTFCEGGSVTLTAPAGYSYAWSTGATSQSISVSTSGSYSVTVTNANGCSATSAPTIVTVNASTAITQQPQSATIAKNTATTLTVGATGSGILSYQWYRGTAGDTSRPVGTGPSYTTPKLTKGVYDYWVRVSGTCGVVGSTTATITAQ